MPVAVSVMPVITPVETKARLPGEKTGASQVATEAAMVDTPIRMFR
jgi:hypothetical protein